MKNPHALACCSQCHRTEEPRANTFRAIKLNRFGLCRACVNANEEVAAEDRARAAALLGKRGGSVTSDRKAAASRANGQKGGRPKGSKNKTKAGKR